MCFYYCKALPSGEDDEEDSDSDSDDDDVKVTIGNIKTGAPSYMYVLRLSWQFLIQSRSSALIGIESRDEN